MAMYPVLGTSLQSTCRVWFNKITVGVVETSVAALIDQKLTSVSRRYRLKASEIAKQADAEVDMLEQLRLVHQALSWIQIALNEEELGAAVDKTKLS